MFPYRDEFIDLAIIEPQTVALLADI